VQFVDTNVLLYSIAHGPEERRKAERANEILSSSDTGLSVQVLQEFYVQATRESRADRITHEQAAGLVDAFRRFRVQETTVALVLAAMSRMQRFGISYWDAAILEAASILGCDIVLSEDMNDGQDYGGVRVQNPFSDC
jgi:predicted nucleic acid-binding protein